MKRSDAVDAIWEELDSFFWEFFIPRRLCVKILDRLEALGMLPPTNKWDNE